MSLSPSSDPLSLLGVGPPGDGTGEVDDPVREQILDAAAAQFSSVGIARSTMGDITRRAGLARMTLYRRFSTKQELVEAALMREASWFLADLQREIDTHDTVEDKLTEGFAFTVARLRNHGLLNRLLETEAESTVPYFTVQGGPLITAAAHFLAGVVSRSVNDSRSHEEVLVVSEVAVRLVISFILSPSMIINLDDPAVMREFARNQLGPLLGPSEFPTGG